MSHKKFDFTIMKSDYVSDKFIKSNYDLFWDTIKNDIEFTIMGYCKATLGGLLRLVPDATHDYIVMISNGGSVKKAGILWDHYEDKYTVVTFEFFTTLKGQSVLSCSAGYLTSKKDEESILKALCNNFGSTISYHRRVDVTMQYMFRLAVHCVKREYDIVDFNCRHFANSLYNSVKLNKYVDGDDPNNVRTRKMLKYFGVNGSISASSMSSSRISEAMVKSLTYDVLKKMLFGFGVPSIMALGIIYQIMSKVGRQIRNEFLKMATISYEGKLSGEVYGDGDCPEIIISNEFDLGLVLQSVIICEAELYKDGENHYISITDEYDKYTIHPNKYLYDNYRWGLDHDDIRMIRRIILFIYGIIKDDDLRLIKDSTADLRNTYKRSWRHYYRENYNQSYTKPKTIYIGLKTIN